MLKMLKKRGLLLLLCIPAALYLMLSTSMWLMTPQESIAQTSANQTMQNQTAQQTSANQTMQNQTVFQRGNVTQGDLEPIEDSLNAAREALQGNFNQTTFGHLSDISNELFRIERLAGPEGLAVMKELQPLQNIIDRAQDALRNHDNPKALQELNSADVEVLKLNQQVPATEEPPED
jgi:CHASE3 domain sensor protein